MSDVLSARIYLTGCGGMLGEAFYQALKNKTFFAGDIDVNDSFLQHADVRNRHLILRQMREFDPDIVIHLAALTDLEYCESHPQEAYDTNTKGTFNVVSACRKFGVPVVHISTAGVFDGARAAYYENDLPNPINVYGKTKHDAELIVSQYPKHYIFRAGWMMGGGPRKDKKFVNKLLTKINSGEKELFVVDDKVGTPTYTYDLVKNIFNVIEKGAHGLYHSVCRGSGSRYDVAQYILKQLRREDVVLHKVTSAEVLSEWSTPRPHSERLITQRLRQENLYTMRGWKTCLKEYLHQWK
jgi:dTDP-4-dehydrorhamnose reductase